MGIPGVETSVQTFGRLARFHPHLHLVVAEVRFTSDGDSRPVDWFEEGKLGALFRACLPDALVAAEGLSEETRERPLSWNPTGFSVYGRQVLAADDASQVEQVLRYVTRPADPQELDCDRSCAALGRRRE